MHRLVKISALAAILVGPCAQAQYTAVSMNPPGASVSRAWGAHGGKEVGQGGGTSIQSAALWSGTGASAIVLTPTGWTSTAFGAGPGQQVGTGSGAGTGFAFHALLWTGTAASMVDLHPAGYDASAAYASDGIYQSGQAATNGVIHAFRWQGTSSSAVDLDPTNVYTESHIYGAFGGRQVGYGVQGNGHALLFTDAGIVDLNGSLDGSIGYAMDATRQVGSGSGTLTGSATHALIWYGGPSLVADINPSGFTYSEADGIAGPVIVGYGSGPTTNNKVHALVWFNGRVIDLHSFLPTGYSSSHAYGIDPITGQIVGEAVNSLNRSIAFMWTPIVKRPPFPPRVGVGGQPVAP